jgi:protein O-mannosyl-transferase
MNAPGAQANFGMPAPAWFSFPALRRWQLDAKQTAMLAGILLVTALVYLRCLENQFVYDDVTIVLHNKYIGQWSYLWKAWTRDLWWFLDPQHLPHSQFYQPLQGMWFAFAYHLFGPNPIGWHVLKIILYLITVALAFRVTQLLTGSTAAALLAALLFGLMPIHVEPVVWATDIPEPLSTAFELAAFCLFIQRSRTSWRGFAWPLLLFLGASFSHEMAVVFPLLIAVYVYLFEGPDGRNNEGDESVSPTQLESVGTKILRAVLSAAPFFAATALYMLARVYVYGLRQVLGLTPTRRTAALVGASIAFHSANAGHTVIQVLMTIPSFLLCYLEILLIPWLAGPAHNVEFVLSPSIKNFYIPIAILSLAALLSYLAIRRSARDKLYLFCVIWWFVTLTPVLVNLDQVIAEAHDRYEYTGSLAFCIMLSDWMVRFAAQDSFRRTVVASLAAGLAVLYLLVLWSIEPLWHDDIVLFSNVVQVQPDSVHFRVALGSSLMERHKLAQAETQYLSAEKLAPDDANIHLALGALYLKMHRGNDASREMAAYYRAVFALKKQTKRPHWYVEFK